MDERTTSFVRTVSRLLASSSVPHMLLDVAELYLEQRLQPTNLAQDQAELQLSISLRQRSLVQFNLAVRSPLRQERSSKDQPTSATT